MMSRWWPRAALFVGAFALFRLACAAAPDAVVLSIACGGCHGTLGVSAGLAMPSLAGQPKEYFVRSMKAFRSGERPSTVMGRLATAYSDAQIDAMAGFYERMRPGRPTAKPDAARLEQGRLVFYKRCRYCHLDRGPLWREIHRSREYDNQCRHCHAEYGSAGREPTPFIAGQWATYLAMQLDAFRSGARRMSADKARSIKALSDADAEAVAQFYASQRLE
ncbi:MAG TPA: c-type cytochrome [Rhodocyclaceae bacterium]